MKTLPWLTSVLLSVTFALASWAESATPAWKVYLTDKNGAGATLTGPREVQSGYAIQSEDGLLEIDSPQKKSANAGYVYTA